MRKFGKITLFFALLCVLLTSAAVTAFAVQGEEPPSEAATQPPTEITTEPAAPDLPFEPTGVLFGDLGADGAVSSAEARRILLVSARAERLPAQTLPLADVNTDGLVTSADARLALRIAAGLAQGQRHDPQVEVLWDPACETAGDEVYTCRNCGLSMLLKIPPMGHHYKQTGRKEPTCTKKGRVTSVCTVCGESVRRELPALGHKWKAATLTAPKRCKTCGKQVTGWTAVGKKWVWFRADGTVKKGVEVRTDTLPDGRRGSWYLVNGVLDVSYRGAVTLNGADWLVTYGAARKAVSAADRTLVRAFHLLERITTPQMSASQKLRRCFVFVRDAYRERSPRSPHYHGMDWPVIYANDMFLRGYGNCFSFASAFAYLAKAIGYENVYCCNSGGHGWAEINGLIYDPEQSKNHSNYTYYGMNYNFQARIQYRKAISPGYAWMHVKI